MSQGLFIKKRGVLAVETWILKLSYLDFRAPSFNLDLELFSLRQPWRQRSVLVKHLIPFDGPGISGVTLSVGTVDALDQFVPAFDIRQAVGGSKYAFANGIELFDFDNLPSIRVAAQSTGAQLSKLTSGSVHILYEFDRLPTYF